MIVSAMHNKIGEFKMAGNPIKMSSYEDKNTRGEIPNLDQHRERILKEFEFKSFALQQEFHLLHLHYHLKSHHHHL